MKINTKKKSAYSIKWLAWGLVFSATIFAFYFVKADSITDISNNNGISDETQQKIDELNKKAEIYRQIIEIKEKQGESLNNQLSINDSNIRQVQAEIEASSRQIEDLNDQIIRLEKQIKEKDDLLQAQKKLLAKILQSYYEVNRSGPLVAYLTNGNIASFMVKKDRIAQTGDNIKELVESISEIKTNLEKQSAELDKKKVEIVEKNRELQNKNMDLEDIKIQRETLLSQTKGEEIRYRKLLDNVNQQKQQLIDLDQFFAASGLSLDSYPKPPESLFASTDWYYSQRDPRWGNENIGNTKTLMKSYGCAVTCVAMVFRKNGGSMDPGDLANQPIFSGDLINWPSTWSNPKLKLSSNGKAHGNISWSTIDALIKKDIPVIVYIKKLNGGGGHYVVVHHKDKSTGKYVVHDPYFGANIFLDTSRALIGAMGKSSSTAIDQMIIYN